MQRQDTLLVYADGLSIEPEVLLRARQQLARAEVLQKFASAIPQSGESLGLPLSSSASLSTKQLYGDPTDQTKAYYLPAYSVGTVTAAEPPVRRYDVRLELTPDLPTPGRLIVGLVATCAADVTGPLPSVEGVRADGPRNLSPLAHTLTLALRYLVSEDLSNHDATSTWRSLAFDSVVQSSLEAARGTAILRTLPELDAVYSALSNPLARAELQVSCEADLAVRTRRQIFVPRPALPRTREPLPVYRVPSLREAPVRAMVNEGLIEQLKGEAQLANPHIERARSLETLRGPQALGDEQVANLRQLAVKPALGGGRLGAFDALQPVGRPAVPANTVVARDPMVFRTELEPPGDVALRPMHVDLPRADGLQVPLGIREPAYVPGPPTTPPIRVPDRPVSDDPQPIKMFVDDRGEPPYVKRHLSFVQPLRTTFEPALHPYVYPARAPVGGAGLRRLQDPGSGQAFFQDLAEPHVFYYTPTAFRIGRDAVRAPTFKPSLQVAFLAERSPGAAGALDYKVQLTYRAVPYLAPGQRGSTLQFIHDQALAPAGIPVSLEPLVPDAAQLWLRLPNDDATGTHDEQRQGATIVFDKYIIDSVTLSSGAFAEVFASMQTGGDTLVGSVRYRLPGGARDLETEFSGRLDGLTGPVLDAQLSAVPAAPGTMQIEISNGIESPITMRGLQVDVLDGAAVPQWRPATVQSAIFPLTLAPGANAAVQLAVDPTLVRALAVRAEPTGLQTAIDFESLWASVLESPGWEGIAQSVELRVEPQQWTAGVEYLVVTFNQGEVSARLDAASPRAQVDVIRPILAYLLKQESADRYVYRVESWRTGAEGPVKVGDSGLLSGKGSPLQIAPPP